MQNKKIWIFNYDPESDEAAFTVPKLSDDARIHYISDDLAVYLSRGKVEGIFIEYFVSDFLQSHLFNWV